MTPSRTQSSRQPEQRSGANTLSQRASHWGDRLTGWPGWGSWFIGLLALAIGIIAFLFVMTVPLEFFEQVVFAVVGLVVAMLFRRIPGRLAALVLILMSVAISSRYLYWRLTETAVFESPLETFLGFGLILAELYAFVILLLGYFQTAWPLRRRPAEMPRDMTEWPTVDVFIPTYNEPIAVVKATVLAAMGMDWPPEKLNVCILDDGRRPEFREFANEVGCTYLTRRDNRHAKAGNINEALKQTKGEFVAVFDCDHIPTRSFLQMTMGWFLKDPRLGILQVPHHFFSPDPFEKNLQTFRRVPNEGELFYGLVQAGNDLWNAAFFCGSAAVLRRRALEDVGGIATDTLTEDAHTSLNLHRAGYTSAYIGIPQASGLGTETLRDHVRQRSRWARGMAQIFRIDNPLFASGLTLAQRLCYCNAAMHFFYGLPRIVFLTAPLAFLFFGLHVYHAPALMIAAFALPHLIHAQMANSKLYGPYRHSFWAEVFESTLAWYVMRAAIGGFLRPSRGAFIVTPKGRKLDSDYFDWRTSLPILILFIANVVGIGFGVVRLLYWNAYEPDTVWMNILWTLFNLIVLGASLAVAREIHQVRERPRVSMRLPAALTLENGDALPCEIANFSDGGVCVRTPRMILSPNQRVTVSVYRGEQEFKFPAQVAFSQQEYQGLRFDKMTHVQESQFLQCTFARADAWLRWTQGRGRDTPLRGIGEVFAASFKGVGAVLSSVFTGGPRPVRQRQAQLDYDRPAIRPGE